MTPSITEDTPTEPTTPNSLAPPEELDPRLHLAAEQQALREEQQRSNQARERFDKDDAHRQREQNGTLIKFVNVLGALEQRMGTLASQQHAEAEARRTWEQKTEDNVSAIASAMIGLTIEMRAGFDRTGKAIEGLKVESDEQKASLLVVDATRAKQDSITDERLSQTDAQLATFQQKLTRAETLRRVALDAVKAGVKAAPGVAKAIVSAVSPVVAWELYKLLKGGG